MGRAGMVVRTLGEQYWKPKLPWTHFEEVAGKVLKENEENLVGSLRRGGILVIRGRKFSSTLSCSHTKGNLAKKLSSHSVEGAIGFLLLLMLKCERWQTS